MSQSSNCDKDRLPSGTYIIHSVKDPKDDERLVMVPVMVPGTHINEVATIKDGMYKWTVTYYKDQDDYTIEETDKEQYVVTNESFQQFIGKVSTGNDAQRFKISPVIYDETIISGVTYNKTVYYKIITTTSIAGDFQCEGDKKQVLVVPGALGRADPSVLWDFEECSPYAISSKTQDYFKDNKKGKLLSRFGLSDDFTWDDLWNEIDNLNNDAQKTAFYKLFLFGRHGHNERNIKQQLGKNYDGIDAALTQRGSVQAGLARAVWDSARAENPGIGLPQLSFCSPMRRALATNSIMFSSELSADKQPSPKMKTVVVENCRERAYTDDSEQRHPQDWIQAMFYDFQLEEGFVENDPLWNPKLKEPFLNFRARGRNVLDRVFAPENELAKFVSITAHHEWTAMIMGLLGQPRAMDDFELEEGGVLAVIVEYTPPAAN